jgi:hypothetical protein
LLVLFVSYWRIHHSSEKVIHSLWGRYATQSGFWEQKRGAFDLLPSSTHCIDRIGKRCDCKMSFLQNRVNWLVLIPSFRTIFFPSGKNVAFLVLGLRLKVNHKVETCK